MCGDARWFHDDDYRQTLWIGGWKASRGHNKPIVRSSIRAPRTILFLSAWPAPSRAGNRSRRQANSDRKKMVYDGTLDSRFWKFLQQPRNRVEATRKDLKRESRKGVTRQGGCARRQSRRSRLLSYPGWPREILSSGSYCGKYVTILVFSDQQGKRGNEKMKVGKKTMRRIESGYLCASEPGWRKDDGRKTRAAKGNW